MGLACVAIIAGPGGDRHVLHSTSRSRGVLATRALLRRPGRTEEHAPLSPERVTDSHELLMALISCTPRSSSTS